jgi:hypothetical protein
MFAGMAALDKMSPLGGKEKTSNFKKCMTDAGMSMKTKDRPSAAQSKAGML